MEPGRSPTVREALLYDRLQGGKVRCRLCERRCVISDGERGFCGTRVNLNGTLYTLVYGDVSSISNNPIEKKPFFHFWPGSLALTVGTWSCNFACPWCQNWEISKQPPDPKRPNYLPPERFVSLAGRMSQGTSISFNEPTLLFEYALDVFRLARERGLYNTYVSNGYMTEEALRALREAGMDAINIDVKGTPDVVREHCKADVWVVWRNAKLAKELGMHVEIICLLITDLNDSEYHVRWLVEQHLKYVGEDTPIHFTRFYPAYRFTSREPTPVERLERARQIAVEEGVKFAYLGNVPGHPWENTYCPECGELLIRRHVFDVLEYRVKEGKCPRCGEPVPIVGKYIRRAPLLWLV